MAILYRVSDFLQRDAVRMGIGGLAQFDKILCAGALVALVPAQHAVAFFGAVERYPRKFARVIVGKTRGQHHAPARGYI